MPTDFRMQESLSFRTYMFTRSKYVEAKEFLKICFKHIYVFDEFLNPAIVNSLNFITKF
jgi:hypothetical protein